MLSRLFFKNSVALCSVIWSNVIIKDITLVIETSVELQIQIHISKLFMPPTLNLKLLVGHIAFGACVRPCFTLFCTSCNF